MRSIRNTRTFRRAAVVIMRSLGDNTGSSSGQVPAAATPYVTETNDNYVTEDGLQNYITES